MEIIAYNKKYHTEIIHALAQALKHGKVVAYPTDTSYGLAVDIRKPDALKRLYQIKERYPTQPTHVLIPSVLYAKKILYWNSDADKLSDSYWPGPLTLVVKLRSKSTRFSGLTGDTGYLGVRIAKQKIAQDIVTALGGPITTTSANPSKVVSGGKDSYSGKQVYEQFLSQKYQPDIILDAGVLPKKKPSTIVKLLDEGYEILRAGPITEKQISFCLK